MSPTDHSPPSDTSKDALSDGSADSPRALFRQEAVEEYQRPRREGDIVRIDPGWATSAYWILFACLIAACALVVFGHVKEYASGPAVVVVAGRTEIGAMKEGTVDAIQVSPGEIVAAGQELVRFRSEMEQNHLERLRYELELELLTNDSRDSDTKSTIARLRADISMAEAQLEERIIRAPHSQQL